MTWEKGFGGECGTVNKGRVEIELKKEGRIVHGSLIMSIADKVKVVALECLATVLGCTFFTQ